MVLAFSQQLFAISIIVTTIIVIVMQIQFDPAKDVLNIKNHGLSLAVAAALASDLLVSLRPAEKYEVKRYAANYS